MNVPNAPLQQAGRAFHRCLVLLAACELALALGPVCAARPGSLYRRLARTMNIELVDETPAWGEQLRDDHLVAIRRAGFTSVRLPTAWAKHAGPAPDFPIDPEHFGRVDRVVRRCLALGLAVVVDNHKDKALMADPAANRDRFLSLVAQVARHYASWPQEVLLEPLAEPHGALDRLWNRYLADALAVLRREDRDRLVLVGPPGYNSPEALPYLKLPSDPALLVVVHVYAPPAFVFQGESFLPVARPPVGTSWNGTPAERQALAAIFDAVAAWGRDHHRLMFVEEVGSTDRADLASRVRWTGCCRELLEARGLAWGVWGFAPTFNIYDLARGDWRRPLLEALIPGAR